MTSHAMTMAAFYGTISHLQFLRFPLGTRAKRWEHFSMEIQIRGSKTRCSRQLMILVFKSRYESAEVQWNGFMDFGVIFSGLVENL